MHLKESHVRLLAYIFFYKCDRGSKNSYILFVKEKKSSFYKMIKKEYLTPPKS